MDDVVTHQLPQKEASVGLESTSSYTDASAYASAEINGDARIDVTRRS
ncbi:hypothetical protein ACFU6S_44260 [Streptomyces sp. NPDC057456]